MTAVRMIEMGAAHLDAVHTIETDASPDPWSRDLFASELDGGGPDRRWLVALNDRGEVVGFGGLLFVLDEAHIMNLAVAPTVQRQGLASALVARLLLDAGDRGTISVTLEVRPSNGPALALYHRFGFESAGRRPGYYPDGEDAVIMWLHRIHRPEVRARLAALAGAEGSRQC
ncbi:MAG: ribosomal protein S18-alanine N-acetyltransferase [Actinomycetota bacterium]